MAIIQEWEGNDLYNLLNLPNYELYRLYGGYMDKHSIRRTANKYRKMHQRGEVDMPERDKPYNPNTEPLEIANRRARASKSLGAKAIETTVLTIPTEHLPFHEKLQEALDTEGTLSRATFTSGEHTGFIKNSENEIEYTDPLKVKRIKFEVDFDTEPKWPPVNRVESVKLPRREQKEADALRTSKRAVILSDLQYPYVDEKALQVALEIVRDAKPDKVVLVGDLLDLSAWSKYIQRPEFAAQTQDAINQAHQLMVKLRQLCPAAEIAVLEGNHDARMEKYALANAQAAYGLKRADQPEGWPVLSVPYLTAMDSLDIDYVSGYPANRHWINKNLQVRHGNLVRSRGNTAVAVALDEKISTIFGHIHRMETQYLTHHTYDGGKTIGAWSIGCLCKIDGSVPSTRGGVDLSGRPVTNYENWTQGLAIATYEEGDGSFDVQPVFMNTFQNYRAFYQGEMYEATDNGN